MAESHDQCVTTGGPTEPLNDLTTELPAECLERILASVPTTSLHRTMIVSKKWERASRYVLKQRHVLRVIGASGLLHGGPTSRKAGKYDVTCPYFYDEKSKLMSKSLVNMTGVVVLDVKELNTNNGGFRKLAAALIESNAGRLEQLRCKDFWFNTLLLPRLRSLICSSFVIGSPAQLPALTKLVTKYPSLHDLNSMPLTQLHDLKIKSIAVTPFPDFLRTMQRLRGLRRLSLALNRKHDVDTSQFHNMFAGYKTLVSLKIKCLDFCLHDGDRLMRRLAGSNQSLEKIELLGIQATDDSLTCLSSLPGLKILTLRAAHGEKGFTGKGVLHLLRGASRHRLNTVDVSFSDSVRFRQIDGEARSIGVQTDTRADVRLHNSTSSLCIRFLPCIQMMTRF